MSPYDTWPSPEMELLVRVLLAEGLEQEAYDLALAVKGARQISLLNGRAKVAASGAEPGNRPDGGSCR